MPFKAKIVILISAFFLGGCVTGTRNIELTPPDFQSAKSQQGTVYIGTIKDNRTFEAKPAKPSTPSVKGNLEAMTAEQRSKMVGRQRNGYGGALGDVALADSRTVQDEIRALLTQGLESRGYTVSNNADSAIKMDVEIDKFWAWFSPGFFAVSFSSELECKINVSQQSGNQTFTVKGMGLNKGQVASDANWELSYKRGSADWLMSLDKSLDEVGL